MNDSPTVVVRQRDGVREFEEHMQAVQNGDPTLRTPKELKHAGILGRSVSFAQLIATWARYSSNLNVNTTLPINSSDDHSKFVSRLHGLATAYFANQVTGKDGTTNLRTALLKAATPRILAMTNRQFDKTARGQLAELIFVHNARNQFHPSIYKRRPNHAEIMDPELHGMLIVSPRELNALVIKVLHTQHVRERDLYRLGPMFNRHHVPVGHLLHETFRNTAEHAYLQSDKRLPSEGLRCILIAIRRATSAALEPSSLLSGDHPNGNSYFQSLSEQAGTVYRKHIFILELSVFDTGPGFAETVTQFDGDDVSRVKYCFSKHGSSKPGPNSGLGLGRILGYIHEGKGFVRVRTSTTEAFFSSNMTELRDKELVPNVAGNLPMVTGTALTIGIPLAL